MKLTITNFERIVLTEGLQALKAEMEVKGFVSDKNTPDTITDLLIKLIPTPVVKKVIKEKKYMFSFEGGGWNTIWAKTKRGAIKAAEKEYKGSDTLNPISNSFHIQTEEGEKSALSLFY
jgi:hypothetical protein